MSSPSPSTVGRYKLLRRIGEDSLAEAWIATAPSGKPVVLKKVSAPTPLIAETFLADAKVLQALSHPNIVPVTDVGVDGSECFMTIGYQAGHTLANILPKVREDGGPAALWIIAQAAKGLAHAHTKGVVHREVSPDKIHIAFDGTVRIADFGLGKIAHLMPQDGLVRGNPPYMSPEQVDLHTLDLDKRSDIFSMGLVLFEALTGERMFQGTPSEIMHLVARFQFPEERVKDLPEDIRTILRGALARERELRTQDVIGMSERLMEVLGAGGADEARISLLKMVAAEPTVDDVQEALAEAAPVSGAAPATIFAPVTAPRRKSRVPILAIGLTLFLFGMVALVFGWTAISARRNRATPTPTPVAAEETPTPVELETPAAPIPTAKRTPAPTPKVIATKKPPSKTPKPKPKPTTKPSPKKTPRR